MAYPRQKLDLSQMSEYEIRELLDSIPTDDEETSDEDYGDGLDNGDNDYTMTYDEPTAEACIENSLEVDELNVQNEIIVSESSEPAILSTSANINPSSASNHNPKRFKRLRPPELTEEEDGPNVSTIGTFTGDSTTLKNDCNEFKSIIWRKKNLQLHVNELVFHGEKQLPVCLLKLKTPYDCFRYFMNDQIIQHLTEQSNLYARQKNIGTKFVVTFTEIRQFVGILVYMSVYRYPNVRSFWRKHGFEAIRLTMPVLRFEEIRRYLHFNDNSAAVEKGKPGYDRLHKLRPLIDHLNERFSSIPMLQRLCVDEQMCATKMTGSILRQYLPNKPHKWGFKFFSLCDTSGFSYSFEVYSGAGDNIVCGRAPDLGSASNVVVRLSQQIPNFVNHILYFDNFYTSLGLCVYLQSRGIFSLGTVRTNRVPNCKLSNDAILSTKKVKRGYSEEYVGTAFGVDISSVLWQDTKTVRLLSTYVGKEPFLSRNLDAQPLKAIRWDKKEKKHYEIDCPNIIKEYNRHMGGVDLMDGLLGRYYIRMKTRKWSSRTFYHLIDVAMVNIIPSDLSRKKVQLPDFRGEVAESLCFFGAIAQRRSVGRPSLTQPPPKLPKRAYFPTEDIRYDQMGH